VRSMAEILARRIKKVAPGNEHLAQIVVDETIRLNSIVVEFLDFARPQKISTRPSSMNDVVKKVVDFISQELSKNKIDMVLDLAPGLPDCNIDQELFYRAMLNILVNAIQAMPEGGELKIISRQGAGGQTELIISDTGIGMSKDKTKEIFTPFFTDKNKGTGLGLAITKNIVDAHNAEIKVESSEGLGTTFTIILPPSL
jgi:two-component system sensor histidine kinase HydH